MTNYYDKQSAKVALMHVLENNGWTIFGYTPDASDAMTDYWSPAHWDGVATKDGFVLLVDQYSTSNSGREVRSYNYNANGTANNYDKIKKLEATMNDEASSENEKEVAFKKIEKLKEVQETSYTVEYVFPTFSHKTPKMSMWHIEKDGEILAKGNGLISSYDTNNRELTNQNMEKLASKFEAVLNGSEQLIKVEKQVVKKVDKLVKSESNELIVDQSIIKLNHNFTGGFYKGTAFVLTKVSEGSEGSKGKKYSFVKLGKKLQKLKEVSNNLLWISEERLLNYISDSTIDVMEIKEVEEVTTKTVYQKAKRKPEQPKGHIEIETINETQEEPIVVSEEVNTNTSEVETSNTITMKLNDDKNGVELYFTDKPSEEIRTELKVNGFRWSRFNKCWYSKQNKDTLALAEKLTNSNVETAENTEPVQIDVPEFENHNKYVISSDLEGRLNSITFYPKDEGYHTAVMHDEFKRLKEATQQIINITDNQYHHYKLITAFNNFMSKYYNLYSSYLNSKANNPSWHITGRGNLNATKYNKKQDALHNKQGKIYEAVEYFESYLNKYENRIYRDRKQAIENKVSKVDASSYEFTTKTIKFTDNIYDMNKRAYICGNYFIIKYRNSYSIYDLHTQKEVHSMKTTQNLNDAKKYVIYLLQSVA